MQEKQDFGTEIDQDRKQSTQMKNQVEQHPRLAESGQKMLGHRQMSGARDGEKLREPLDDTEKDSS
jgi:hypothetical protein